MKWKLAVLAIGLMAAGPFLTTGPVGTNEAYNYSLGLADAVSQMRAGTVPVLAGQTEFAFNGRIHPIRTAPYFYQVAGLIDLLTLRRLGFWALQNLVLSLSLVGGALACFWALRRVTPASPPLAVFLTACFILSPPVLAAAYGMDLYMTVAALPFVPPALALGLAGYLERRPTDLVKLAAALAACWWAHPPVALWVTLVAALLAAAGLVRRPPGGREWLMLVAVALLFLALAGFAFASALTVAPLHDLNIRHDLALLFAEVSRTFPATLRPVSAGANQLGDFQLGYFGWALAISATGLAIARRDRPALLLLAAAGLLLVMTTPVPGVNQWLWRHAPAVFFNLTNQWPMQRLYLIVTLLLLLAFGRVWRMPASRAPLVHDAARLFLAAAMFWTAWQSVRFISRGFATQASDEAIRRGHVSGNIDLTPISYALLGTPATFVNGPMDPAFEFRLLAPYDLREIGSNWTAPLPPAAESRQGRFVAHEGARPEILDLAPDFTLQPGVHYRLSLDFLVQPAPAILQLRGPTLFREYPLPAAGGPRGFGMQAGNNPRLTLWTAQDTPEEISLRVVGPGLGNGPWAGRRFANFSFERIDPKSLPVRLESLLPLRAAVKAPADSYLETPRMFIPGYRALVDGRPVRVQPSSGGLVMFPVPAGESHVELDYRGPVLVRVAFWVGCLAWAGLGTALVVRRPAWIAAWRVRCRLPGRKPLVLGAVALLTMAGCFMGWQRWMIYRAGCGPVRIRFVLPRGETNRQQPLLVTGRPHAGTFVYVVYADAEHIRLGVDVWGLLGVQSDPIRVDYYADHEVVIDAGALYPRGHPALAGLAADRLAGKRRHLRVSLDGRIVLDREIDTYASSVREVTVGENRIGGSSCEPAFAGQILSVERLPVPLP